MCLSLQAKSFKTYLNTPVDEDLVSESDSEVADSGEQEDDEEEEEVVANSPEAA